MSGNRPESVLLEEVRGGDWEEAERFWIAYWKFLGASLTNLTEGGECGGSKGRVVSEETRRRISLSQIGIAKPHGPIPPLQREKMRIAALKRYSDQNEKNKTRESVINAYKNIENRLKISIGKKRKNKQKDLFIESL